MIHASHRSAGVGEPAALAHRVALRWRSALDWPHNMYDMERLRGLSRKPARELVEDDVRFAEAQMRLFGDAPANESRSAADVPLFVSRIQRAAGKLSEAARSVELYLRIRPDNVDAHLEAARIFAALEQRDVATTHLSQIASVPPESLSPRVSRGALEVASVLGDHDLAERLELGVDGAADDNPDVLLSRAIRAQAVSDWPRARYFFKLTLAKSAPGSHAHAMATKLSRVEENFIRIDYEGRFFFLLSPVAKQRDGVEQRRTFQEHETLEFLRRSLPDHKTILDVGCNIGNHSLFFYHYLKWSTIVGFDPAPMAGFYYCQNVPEARFFNLALGERDADVTVVGDVMNSQFAQSRIVTETSGMRLDCKRMRTHAIDDLGFRDVTLLKVDVESWELPVLRGGLRTIRRDRPAIVIEFLDENRESYGSFFERELPEYRPIHTVQAQNSGRQDIVFAAT